MNGTRLNENWVVDWPREAGKRVKTESDELANPAIRDNDEEHTERVKFLLSDQIHQYVYRFEGGEGAD